MCVWGVISRCPLVDVASIISQDNVWACLHRNVRPCDLNLDLNDLTTWSENTYCYSGGSYRFEVASSFNKYTTSTTVVHYKTTSKVHRTDAISYQFSRNRLTSTQKYPSLPPRLPFFSSTANPAPPQGYTSIQEEITYRPTQQFFVYEVEDLVREALKREMRYRILIFLPPDPLSNSSSHASSDFPEDAILLASYEIHGFRVLMPLC